MLKKDEYFTAGQLASLYGIPKQTLLYYDKSELLIPEFIHDNGYRYYSVSQYLTLEIILNMRKLNIPINDIKEYLNNRNTKNFQQLLQKKQQECDNIIAELQQTKESLALSLNALSELTQCPLEQIQLSFQTAKPLLVSDSLINTKTVRERVKILAHHNQKTFDKNHFKEFSTGWIISQHDFSNKVLNKTTHYFTPVPDFFNSQQCFIRPSGMYISINFKGTYYARGLEIQQQLLNFLNLNKLQITSDIYILPLKNHWLTEDLNSYINQITFQVEPLLTIPVQQKCDCHNPA